MTKLRMAQAVGKIDMWCIFLVIFVAPFSKSLSEICVCIAIVGYLTRLALGYGRGTIRDDLAIPFVLLVVSFIPSLFTTPDLHLSAKALFSKWIKYILLYFAAIDALDTRQKIKDLCVIACISICFIAADGFIQYFVTGYDILHMETKDGKLEWAGYLSFKHRIGDIRVSTGNTPYRGFPTASFPFPNDLAAWILLVIFPVVAVAMFGIRDKIVRPLLSTIAIALFALLFMAKTRAAWLGMAISTFYMALSRKKIWLLVGLVLLVAIPWLFRMEMAQDIFSTGSLGDRMGMWSTGIMIFKDHPVVGNGVNTFFVKFMEHRQDEWRGKKGSYAHNCFLQLACDSGLIGLGAFLYLVASFFLYVIRGLEKIGEPFFHALAWGLSIGIFAFLVQSFFDTNLYSLNLATMFWVSFAICASIVRVFRGSAA